MNAAADIPSPKPTRAPWLSPLRIAVLSGAALCSLVTLGFLAVGKTDCTKVRWAQRRLQVISTALQNYHAEHAAYPAMLEPHLLEYLTDIDLKDAWAQNFEYTPRADASHPFLLRSIGEDGFSGTPDDIDVWTMKSP